MIRDKVTITELELLCFLCHSRNIKELADFLGVTPMGAQTSTCRLDKKGLIDIDAPHSPNVTYKISQKGEALLDELENLRYS